MFVSPRIDGPRTLQRIFVGNGEGVGDKKLQAGVLNASDRETGRPGTFFEIEKGSLVVVETSLRNVDGSLQLTARGLTHVTSYSNKCAAESTEGDGCSQIPIQPVFKTQDIPGVAERSSDEYPGVEIDCFGPGGRLPNPAIKTYAVRSQAPVVMKCNDEMCSVVALVNAMAVLSGCEALQKVKNK